MGKKEKTLSWDDFQSLGNPENAPDLPENSDSKALVNLQSRIRVFLDRKRGGKIATVTKGFSELDDADTLKSITKSLKLKLGVGGNYKHHEIILQGEKRKQVIEFLTSYGFKDVKAAGG